MGSKPSYKEYGESYDSSKVCRDVDGLKKINHTPHKITHIRFYYQGDYIIGIETFYDGISAGAHLGLEFRYFDF